MSSPTSKILDSNRSSHALGSNRVLACVACRQRKIRCSRSFPCTNCQAMALNCIPAIPVTRRRRPRHDIPYKILLEQIQTYENLLQKHDIKFRSLEDQSDSKGRSSNNHSDEEFSETPRTRENDDGSETISEAISPTQKMPLFSRPSQRNAMLRYLARLTKQKVIRETQDGQTSSQDEDIELEKLEYDPWELGDSHHNSLLFKSFEVNLDISSLHPDPAQIFQLWQIYLDNVNPLLKISHQPTLQADLVKYVNGGRMQTPTPEFSALMFSIYCVAVQSLHEDECQAIFGSAKSHLMQIYHFACEQALHACNFLATKNCDCLRALLLYLISQGARHNPRSISAMTGAAIRIAERIGIDAESENAKHSLFEAEMRRRLWWSLVLFDNRITGLSSIRPNPFSGSWDCKLPLNVNDIDFRPETKKLPKLQTLPSDNIFLLLRAELAMYNRSTPGDSIPLHYSDLTAFETRINNLYLQACNEEIPIQLATLWMTRGFIAKFRLSDYQNLSINHGIHLLDCDTKIMSSALLTGYVWFFELYFPLPGYIHIVMALRDSPMGDTAEQAWEALANNHYARFPDLSRANTLILDLCNKAILQAWQHRETFLNKNRHGLPVTLPRVVTRIHEYYIGVPAMLQTLQSDQEFNLFEQDFSQIF